MSDELPAKRYQDSQYHNAEVDLRKLQAQLEPSRLPTPFNLPKNFNFFSEHQVTHTSKPMNQALNRTIKIHALKLHCPCSEKVQVLREHPPTGTAVQQPPAQHFTPYPGSSLKSKAVTWSPRDSGRAASSAALL